ncbi:hypothetical protein [Galactobacter valiniphilus]|nr:hypothetical protein [Galactobacter valiniphilus]
MMDLGTLLFELSELERGQERFVCTAFSVREGAVVLSAAGREVTVPLGATRGELHRLLTEAGIALDPPHEGELPPIEAGGPHLDWVELLRDLASGPDDLASTGTGLLLSASTDGSSALVTLRNARGVRHHPYAFDGSYPAAVALDFATDP